MPKEKSQDRKFDVFISYSSKEKAIADAVVAAHEQAGIRCWYAPRDIGPGADWAEAITKAIHDCSLMVLIFSKEANRSQRVIDEVNYAISQEKALLPFRVESANPTGALSLHLSSRHWLDAYESGWETHIDRLVNSVRINLENVIEAVQISGGEAPSIVGGKTPKQVKKQGFLKTFGYLAGALIVISLLGYFGWNYLGKELAFGTSTNTPVEYTPTVPLPEPTETEETSEALPPEAPSYTAILHGSIEEQSFSLDPQLNQSSGLTKSLFLTLTEYDFENAMVIPRAAESWTVSPDGLIYTFRLHSEIPWVTHTLGGDTVQVTDEEGNPRYLTAADFAYAYKRLCDPAIDEFYPRPTNVQGCSDVLEYPYPQNIPPELFDKIGVEAVSDTELIFYLEEPSGYFLTKTANYTSSAVPVWAMEKYGEAWTNPGLMPTNGDFVIDQWVAGETICLVRNELLPAEMHGDGNIKAVELVMVEGDSEAYELWKTKQIDYAHIPQETITNHLDQYPVQSILVSAQLVYYAIFNLDQFPFNNVHLRRAFSAAFNREVVVTEILEGEGTPMKHFAPPGVFGAPPVDEVGIGYDLEYARSELELAGYPQCQGLRKINFYSMVGVIANKAENIARSWEEGLECPEGTIVYQDMTDFGSVIESDRYDIFITGWASDYPDEENWVGTVLNCDLGSWVNRRCNEIDGLIDQAREEISASDRAELYYQIERLFFGYEGTFPIAPLFSPLNHVASSDWFEYIQFGDWFYDDYSNWRIDMDAKEAALGE